MSDIYAKLVRRANLISKDGAQKLSASTRLPGKGLSDLLLEISNVASESVPQKVSASLKGCLAKDLAAYCQR